MKRTHVVLPSELVNEIDELVGPRGRSHFLAEAAEEKLMRIRRLQAAEAVRGSLNAADYPEWSSPEAVAEWVHKLRHEGDRPIPDLYGQSESDRASL